MPPSDRTADVWEALRHVTDPELDESVVDLGFISEVAVEAGRAAVSFRLPTFWCSANFAFIMAEDMREALARLDWLDAADIRLVEHFASDKINAGIAVGRGFADVFAAEAVADLAAVRQQFRRKAYLGRMSALIELLRERGKPAAEIVAMRICDLQTLGSGPIRPAIERFLERRCEFGGPAEAGSFAFRRPEGEAIDAGELLGYLREIRMLRRSVEANGEMCRMILAARREFPVCANAPPAPPRRSRTVS